MTRLEMKYIHATPLALKLGQNMIRQEIQFIKEILVKKKYGSSMMKMTIAYIQRIHTALRANLDTMKKNKNFFNMALALD